MKKSKLLNIVPSFIMAFLIIMLFGCTESVIEKSDESKVIFKETFNSYNAANWDQYGNTLWVIDTDSGNKVIGNDSGNSGFNIYKNYSSSNYTVTARMKPVSKDDIFAGIIIRFFDSSNFYLLSIDADSPSPPSMLVLRKFSSGSGNAAESADFVSTIDTTKWYTLTVTVNGTVITGKVTDGFTTATLTYNDNVNFNGGPAILSGKAGLADQSINTNSYFDDFTIREP